MQLAPMDLPHARELVARAAQQLDHLDGALMRATLDRSTVMPRWENQLRLAASATAQAADAVLLLGPRYAVAAQELRSDAIDIAQFSAELAAAAARGERFGDANAAWGRRLAPAAFGARFTLGLLANEPA